MLYRQKKTWARNFLVHASNAVLWAFSATILRPLTLARNYANLRRTKKQIKEGNGKKSATKGNEDKTCFCAGESGAARKRFSGAASRPHGRWGEAGCKVRSAYFADCVRLNGMRSVERSGLRGVRLSSAPERAARGCPCGSAARAAIAADLYQRQAHATISNGWGFIKKCAETVFSSCLAASSVWRLYFEYVQALIESAPDGACQRLAGYCLFQDGKREQIRRAKTFLICSYPYL